MQVLFTSAQQGEACARSLLSVQVLFTNKRFKDVHERAQQYVQQEHAQQQRGDYASGIAALHGWLDASEALLNQRLECEHAVLREHLLQLEDAVTQELEIENQFKATSKTAQTLVKDSPQATIQEMLNDLKVSFHATDSSKRHCKVVFFLSFERSYKYNVFVTSWYL